MRECPICGYCGYFFACGVPLRYDATCAVCRSLERHRQHFLLVQHHPQWIDGARLLHFTPEPCFVSDYTQRATTYVRANYEAGPNEVSVDIQKIQFGNNSFDTVICHQIMEHVPNDRAGLSELYRVVRPGGTVLISTPIIETWDSEYENPAVVDEWQRDLYFNQDNHVRIYGRNFRQLLSSVGFHLSENIAREPDVSRYSLIRGEVIFIATKNF